MSISGEFEECRASVVAPAWGERELPKSPSHIWKDWCDEWLWASLCCHSYGRVVGTEVAREACKELGGFNRDGQALYSSLGFGDCEMAGIMLGQRNGAKSSVVEF